MNKKLFTLITLILFCATLFSQNTKMKSENKTRLAIIEVDSTRLEEYNAFLKEEIEASIALEPGVLTLYAVASKEHPNRITILEIYASEEAYQSHIKTPHFLKYKNGTLDMVLHLELVEVDPIVPQLKLKQE